MSALRIAFTATPTVKILKLYRKYINIPELISNIKTCYQRENRIYLQQENYVQILRLAMNILSNELPGGNPLVEYPEYMIDYSAEHPEMLALCDILHKHGKIITQFHKSPALSRVHPP